MTLKNSTVESRTCEWSRPLGRLTTILTPCHTPQLVKKGSLERHSHRRMYSLVSTLTRQAAFLVCKSGCNKVQRMQFLEYIRAKREPGAMGRCRDPWFQKCSVKASFRSVSSSSESDRKSLKRRFISIHSCNFIIDPCRFKWAEFQSLML